MSRSRSSKITPRDYSVGYRKPPISGQFKKGESGNRKGRPKGSMTLAQYLDRELNRTVSIKENGAVRRITLKEAAIKRLVGNLLTGDPRTMKFMLDYFGMPIETEDPRTKAESDEGFKSFCKVLDELATRRARDAE